MGHNTTQSSVSIGVASVSLDVVSGRSDSGGIIFTEKNTSFDRIQLYVLSNFNTSDEEEDQLMFTLISWMRVCIYIASSVHSPGHSHVCTPLSGMMWLFVLCTGTCKHTEVSNIVHG